MQAPQVSYEAEADVTTSQTLEGGCTCCGITGLWLLFFFFLPVWVQCYTGKCLATSSPKAKPLLVAFLHLCGVSAATVTNH